MSSPAYLNRQRLLQSIDKAFDQWEPHAGVRFDRVQPNMQADIEIRWQNHMKYDILYGEGVGGLLSRSDKHTIIFNGQEKWMLVGDPVPRLGGFYIYNVLIHQAGKVLGLSNSGDSEDVMYPYYNSTKSTLSEDDVNSIRTLYQRGQYVQRPHPRQSQEPRIERYEIPECPPDTYSKKKTVPDTYRKKYKKQPAYPSGPSGYPPKPPPPGPSGYPAPVYTPEPEYKPAPPAYKPSPPVYKPPVIDEYKAQDVSYDASPYIPPIVTEPVTEPAASIKDEVAAYSYAPSGPTIPYGAVYDRVEDTVDNPMFQLECFVDKNGKERCVKKYTGGPSTQPVPPPCPPIAQPEYGQPSYEKPVVLPAPEYGKPSYEKPVVLPAPEYGQPSYEKPVVLPAPEYGQPSYEKPVVLPAPEYGQPSYEKPVMLPAPEYGQPSYEKPVMLPSPEYGQPPVIQPSGPNYEQPVTLPSGPEYEQPVTLPMAYPQPAPMPAYPTTFKE